jgi:hypothetical protein
MEKKTPYSPKGGKRAKSIQDLRDYAKTLAEGSPAEEAGESEEVEAKEKATAPKGKGKVPPQFMKKKA